MSPAELSFTVANVVNILSAVFALTAVFCLVSARRDGAGPGALAVVVAAAFGWGAAHSFYPPLVAWRAGFFPAQPIVIFSLVVALSLLSRTAPGVAYFRAAKLGPLIALYGWRTVFGSALLVLGLSGALPDAFFWVAAIGDIVVGLWALSMLPRMTSVTRWELLAWNVIGLVDLLNVLRLGLLELRPFYEANLNVPRLALLPLFGVPFFVALHIQLFRTIWRHRSA